MLYITSPPSIVHPIRAEQKNIGKWFIHQKRTGSADLKNSHKTGSNPSKGFYWISLSLSLSPPCPHKNQKAWDSPFVSTVVGTIMEETGGTKVHFALLLGPISADPGRPKPPSFMVSHNTPYYSCSTWCEVITYLLGPRGMKITLPAMMSDPSDGVAEMSVPQTWSQWTWVSHFLTTSAPGWQSFLQLCHSTYIHFFISAC